MNGQINTLINELDIFDTVLDKLECCATTCRIEFVHPEGNPLCQDNCQEAFIESMMASEMFSSEFQVHNIPNDQGDEITRVYLARPKENLFAYE